MRLGALRMQSTLTSTTTFTTTSLNNSVNRSIGAWTTAQTSALLRMYVTLRIFANLNCKSPRQSARLASVGSDATNIIYVRTIEKSAT
jgi:hypothetical protein